MQKARGMAHPPTITLCPFTAYDEYFVTELARDERVTRLVGDGQPWDKDMIAARMRIALEQTPVDTVGAVRWFLSLAGPEPVGVLVSTRRESGVEIGYGVSSGHWGRGIAGAMVEQAVDVIPELFGCGRLLAQVSPTNPVSARVLTRRGFRLACTADGLDQYLWDAGRPR